MQIGPHTVTRGTMVPYRLEARTSQLRKVAADGSVTVIDQLFNRELYIRAKIKVPNAEADTIAGFLEAVGFARDTFSLEDAFAVVRTVRFWDRRIRRNHIAGGLTEMDLLFRQEV